jgi:hypothetical protein
MTIATTDHAPTSLGADHDRHEAIDIRYVLPHMLPEVQQREALDETRIRAYAALYRDGHSLDEIMVFQEGQERYVADGFHRIAAAIQAGLDTLPATIRLGTVRDAILYACGCNLHGVPLTQADKRRRVMTMLADLEWCAWSNYEIAKHCGVAESFVRKCRASLRTERSEKDTQRTYRTKHGTLATMDTTAIGKRPATDASKDAGTPRVSRPPDVATDTAEVAPGNTGREAISQARQDHTIDLTTPAFAEVIGEAAGRQVALVSPDGSLQDGLMKAAAAVWAASPPTPVAALGARGGAEHHIRS